MSELSSKTCTPCEGGTPALSPEKVAELARQLDGWTVVENRQIEKEYRFPDFRQALAFVNKLGDVAEAEGHHPDIFLAWGKVKVTLWTHAVSGLSENDFILAAKADEQR